MSERILICGTQIPFTHGGAENLIESLAAQLTARGHSVEQVRLPFSLGNRHRLIENALAWRLIDLSEFEGRKIDRVIATRFPSYLVRHPNKVVWLVHQLRQVYELMGTPYSDFRPGDPADDRAIELIRGMDRRTLGEARRLFSISQNTADRLARFNGLEAKVLYPPPMLADRLAPGPAGDYILAAGRLDPLKRFDRLVEAMAHAETPVRCRLAGVGPDAEKLSATVRRLRLEDRVELLGWVDDEALAELYGGALGVYYAPFDEDYGYVTVEAFLAEKPIVTTGDSGGVLELVEDGVTGLVAGSGSPRAIAACLDRLYRDRERAAQLGAAGRRRVSGIGWDRVLDGLLS